jgi:hypothetical protein
MGSSIAIDLPEGVEWPEGVPFKDWLRVQREMRRWSRPRLAREVAALASAEAWENRKGEPPGASSILKLIYRWEAGTAGISPKYLHLVAWAFAGSQDPLP